jgi:hypothetical protein
MLHYVVPDLVFFFFFYNTVACCLVELTLCAAALTQLSG